MNLRETLKELVVVRVVGGGKFVDDISETDMELFVNGSDSFECARFVELLQEAVVLFLEIVLELGV